MLPNVIMINDIESNVTYLFVSGKKWNFSLFVSMIEASNGNIFYAEKINFT